VVIGSRTAVYQELAAALLFSRYPLQIVVFDVFDHRFLKFFQDWPRVFMGLQAHENRANHHFSLLLEGFDV
jgi:hypothetical protein